MAQITDQLNFELTNVFELYQTRMKIFELTQKAFLVSKDNLEIAKLKEQSGLINSFNFRDIEMAYLSAGVALYQASYDLLESNATLLKMTGKIIQRIKFFYLIVCMHTFLYIYKNVFNETTRNCRFSY